MPEDRFTEHRQPRRGRAARQARRQGLVEETPRLRVHRERRKRTVKRTLAVLALTVVLAVVGSAAYAFVTLRQSEREWLSQAKLDPKLPKVIAPKPKPKEPFNILLLGADYRPGETQYRADTIILARVDPAKRKVWMVSIPRDTKVRIPGRGTMKINAANYTGPSGMITAVKSVTGLPINYYMEVNFRGFQRLVDDLDGVWIDVPVDIDDWHAAGHSPGHRARKIDKGYQLLDGEHALTFVRARKQFIDQDFSRMRNQQMFFKALAKQASDPKNVLKLPTLVRHTAKTTKSNMPFSKMYEFAMAMKGIKENDIEATTLKGEWDGRYVVTDEVWLDHIKATIQSSGSFEATAAPSAGAATVRPSETSVTIRNGAGIGGVAKEASEKLQLAGFQIGEVGNANQFVYQETLVVYRDSEAAAQMVLDKLPVGRVVPSRGMYKFSSDILVVVGRDWRVPTKKPTSPQAEEE